MTSPLPGIAEEIRTPALGQNLQYAQLRQGTVTGVNLGTNTCSINLSGDTATTIDNVACLGSYVPTVNDNVYLLKSGSDLIALGTITVPTVGPSGTVSTQIIPGQGSSAGSSALYSRGDHAHGNPVYPHADCVLGGFSGTATSVSSSYNTVGFGSSFSFTKNFSATSLHVSMQVGFYVTGTANGTEAQFAVNINGTDWTIARKIVNDGLRKHCGGFTVATGMGVGTYTCALRVARTAGTGTITMDSSDWYSISVIETG